jgi:predicted Fe-S protein YdhL (DUF1289 family)
MNQVKISTPCIGECGIDEENGLCRGCWRSRREIVAWRSMDEAERQALMRRLPFRSSVKTVADRHEHVIDLAADGVERGDQTH